MNQAVIDTSVFVSGIFWSNEPHRVLRGWQRGIIQPILSDAILSEYDRIAWRIKTERNSSLDLDSLFEELRAAALWVRPTSLSRKVCRDPNDDMFIEAALAAECHTVIARDPDLTVLRKPFGISILTPRQWLASLSREQRRLLA